MAAVLGHLLRLPPCLRHQVIVLETSTAFTIRKRLVSNPLNYKLQSRCITQPATSRTAALPKPFKKLSPGSSPPRPSRAMPPNPPTPKYTKSPPGRDTLNNLPTWNGQILLYKSTGHGSFFMLSYLVGGFLLIGAFSHAQWFIKDPKDGTKRPRYTQALGGVMVIAVAAMATLILLAPVKMIKSISLVSALEPAQSVTASRKLRLEIKRALPILKPNVLEVLPSQVALNRSVPGAVHQLRFQSVPSKDAQTFTESYLSGAKSAEKQGILPKLASFNRAFIHAWPILKRETRRMCLRDQMAYVRVTGTGNFKLDLQDCTLLDGGLPLEKLMKPDPNMSIWEKVKGVSGV